MPRPCAGFSVGILCLDTRHQLVPGNVQHAESFDFPVLYEVVKGVSGPALMRGDPAAAGAIIRHAKTLQESGVDVIVGACGSFAFYQQAVSAEIRVPVVLSILLEVPLLLRALPPKRKLGIIFASVSSFTAEVCKQCDISDLTRILPLGADSLPEFQPILQQRPTFDSGALEAALATFTRQTAVEHPEVGMWLLQCSDLPPYAAAIQGATGLPVFDMVTLIRHLRDATARRPYTS
jgi:hypothetical protein